MNNPESLTQIPHPLERDMYRHREELDVIAEVVAKEERYAHPIETKLSPQQYHYLLIDLAAAAGFEIDTIDASELIQKAMQRMYMADLMETNTRDGTWDYDGNPITYDITGNPIQNDNALMTGENDG